MIPSDHHCFRAQVCDDKKRNLQSGTRTWAADAGPTTALPTGRATEREPPMCAAGPRGPRPRPPNTPSAAAAAAPAGAGGCRRPLSLLHTWSPCGRKGAVEGTSHALDRGPRQLARSTLRLPRLAPTNRRAAGSSPALQRGCGRGGITPAVAATMTNEEQS